MLRHHPYFIQSLIRSTLEPGDDPLHTTDRLVCIRFHFLRKNVEAFISPPRSQLEQSCRQNDSIKITTLLMKIIEHSAQKINNDLHPIRSLIKIIFLSIMIHDSFVEIRKIALPNPVDCDRNVRVDRSPFPAAPLSPILIVFVYYERGASSWIILHCICSCF
jgi:hypothetical protein